MIKCHESELVCILMECTHLLVVDVFFCLNCFISWLFGSDVLLFVLYVKFQLILYFAVMVMVFIWTIVTKPVQLLVSHTLVALRTMARAVYMLFSSRASSKSACMYAHACHAHKCCISCMLLLSFLLSCQFVLLCPDYWRRIYCTYITFDGFCI